MLESSTDKALQELSHRVILSEDICTTVKGFFGKKEIIIEEIDGLLVALVNKCADLLTTGDWQSLRMTNDNVFQSNHAWAFKKGTPFLHCISMLILRFHESGIMNKWSEYIYTPSRHRIWIDGNTFKDLRSTISNFYGQFVLWVIGIILSFLCFLLEIFVYSFHRK